MCVRAAGLGAAPWCREGGWVGTSARCRVVVAPPGWPQEVACAGHEVRVTSIGTIKMPNNVGVAW